MASSSSSSSMRYDVFSSFSGEDVRRSFLSHLVKEFDRKSIIIFIDNKIERSRPIGPELLKAITESKISIVIFSKKYASSTWCLDELVEIHKCSKNLGQMVFPVFYDVYPTDVEKQTNEFGKFFKETCIGQTEEDNQRWKEALEEVACIAGEDLKNWPDEAEMVEKIAIDVLNKLMITPSNCFGEYVGIEAHIEAIKSLLCLESKEARMVGILGPSGIGKSTIGSALFSQLSWQFDYHTFGSYKRSNQDLCRMKLKWQEKFLSEILRQKDIKVEQLGVVEQRLHQKKVLIVLDAVDDLELLKTLVGQTEWFGFGSRIIVITQDRQLLNAHKIDLIYEVKLPSEDLALEMLSQAAFRQNSPPDEFMELALKVTKVAGNLPLYLSFLGLSLRGRGKKEWMEILTAEHKGLNGNIKKILRVSYDKLDKNDQELFLHIAISYLFSGSLVNNIKDLLGDTVDFELARLAEKSLISIKVHKSAKRFPDKSVVRITPYKSVEMHKLLQKLGVEIIRAESNPGKRRFLVDFEDIRDVFTRHTGTEAVIGIYFNTSAINEPFTMDENSFEGMQNLQFLNVYDDCSFRVKDKWYQFLLKKKPDRLNLPRGLVYLPRKLRLLKWDAYPLKCLPSSFMAEYLVELIMMHSKLEKLWDGVQPLGRLKKLDMHNSSYLKEIPDLSKAINLEELNLSRCSSLVTLPSSIQKVIKLRSLDMAHCKKLKSLPRLKLINLESLEYFDCTNCSKLEKFPQIIMDGRTLSPHKTPISDEKVEFSLYVANSSWEGDVTNLWTSLFCRPSYLESLMKFIPRQFRIEHLVSLRITCSQNEKLWEGVQSLASLRKMDLSGCGNLTEIPNLSEAPSLETLILQDCHGLMTISTDYNVSSLTYVNLTKCSRLESFPQISWSIKELTLNETAIEEVPSWIEKFSSLTLLYMRDCERLKNISPNIFRLTRLERADFSDSAVKTIFSNTSVMSTTEDYFSRIPIYGKIDVTPEDSSITYTDDINTMKWIDVTPQLKMFFFLGCFKLDGEAQELILRSYWKPTIIPGLEVPSYFTHQTSESVLTVTLPQSSLSQDFLLFKGCFALDSVHFWSLYSDVKVLLTLVLTFRGVVYVDTRFKFMVTICAGDHLVLVSFGIPIIGNPTDLNDNDVEFHFICSEPMIGCGVRLLNAVPSEAE